MRCCARVALAIGLALACACLASGAQAEDFEDLLHSRVERASPSGDAPSPRIRRTPPREDATPRRGRARPQQVDPTPTDGEAAASQQPTSDRRNSAAPAEVGALAAMVHRLTETNYALVDSTGKVIGWRGRGREHLASISEPEVVAALAAAPLTDDQAARLWSLMADESYTSLVTPKLVSALIAASRSPKARDVVWAELAGLARDLVREPYTARRERSLLGFFERNRALLRPFAESIAQDRESTEDLLQLMHSARVFGNDIDESIAFVTFRTPGIVAERIERERELGRPARWEYIAFESMMRWKSARLGAGASQPPRTLAELDAAGEAFVTMFNCLHGLDPWYREQMLRGLGPSEIFNVVVGGEMALYRLGTSGYRNFLHKIILRGIKEAGSLEAFLERAAPRGLGAEAARAAGRRGMTFVRVASSFGLVDQVLDTVRDRDRFIASVIDGLGEPGPGLGYGSIVLDVLTSRQTSATAQAFKRAMLDALYERYATETRAEPRQTLGSLLSVYQTVMDDRREPAVDAAFPLDAAMFQPTFDRLYSKDASGRYVHRMFMRMDEDIDASSTYSMFRSLMSSMGASVRESRTYDVYRIAGTGSQSAGRTIEIYANKPTAQGVREGIDNVAQALAGLSVETVIGRGHTGIIGPLRTDAKRVLGERVKSVATVIVGACGGDASVRELIDTFGHVPFFSTKATGRQVINDAIIQAYINALLSLQPGETLAMRQVLERGVARFVRGNSGEELRSDANLYQVNMATVLAAKLIDAQMPKPAEGERVAANP